ncbi:DUF1932 domain-containing protein [Frankia sp. AgB32]|uniref:DUF1932 domain-containing protein n=1 Tax=Frankia sp. AgB32 TaxID=631119 RepID=UPI00200EAF31|nr:DUF1932 domain-containing protein [Frankia sp. AgB32]
MGFPRSGIPDLVPTGHPRRDTVIGRNQLRGAGTQSTASVYKGLAALFLHAAASARRAGVLNPVLDDLTAAFPDEVQGLGRFLALSASKSGRYVDEMREIAATQDAAGLPPELFTAMATVWERVAATPLGALTPEDAAGMSDLDDVLRALDDHDR